MHRVYGFKPTAFRIPTDGWGYLMAGADVVDSVLGPISTSVEGLKLFMKAIIDAKPWYSEPALIPMPWTPISFPHSQSAPLKIGVMWHDNIVTPHPPITRALQEIVAKMREYVTFVDWTPYCHDEAWAIISSLYYIDGGAEDSEAMKASGEPWLPLTRWILSQNPSVKKLTAEEVTFWTEEREAYRKQYAIAWNQTGDDTHGSPTDMMDAILCPVGPGVAPKHNTAKYWGYSSQWNLLDYPAACFPVTRVDKNVDRKVKLHRKLSPLDSGNWNLCEFIG